jgi:hypothetical protein
MTAIDWLRENSHIIPKGILNKRKLIEKAKEIEIYQTDNKVISFAEWLTGTKTIELMEFYEEFENEFYPKEKL